MINLLPFIHTSGISLPLFSLRYRDDFGIGDIRGAYTFVDFLSASGQSVWNMLPITETTNLSDNSPYDPISSFAIDPVYTDVLSLEDFPSERYADFQKEKITLHQFSSVHYEEVRKVKDEVLRLAFQSFLENEVELGSERAKEFADYCAAAYGWLHAYAMFKSLLVKFNYMELAKWPKEIREKDKHAIADYTKELHEEMMYQQYVQWILQKQWMLLKEYANARGVYLFGDIPFYTGLNSVEVWDDPSQFYVHKDLSPSAYGGAPPDFYAVDGQIWEMAVSKWPEMEKDEYVWWKSRLQRHIDLFDEVRLDHFRGFFAYWHIQEGMQSKDGAWVRAPGMDILYELVNIAEAGEQLCAICADNLGYITKDVEGGLGNLGISGYALFFESFKHMLNGEYDPYSNCQSTTHDSLPLIAWWRGVLNEDKRLIMTKLGVEETEERLQELDDDLRFAIIEYIYSCSFSMKTLPLQDILGSEERINTPGTRKGNWEYRMGINCEDLLDHPIRSRLDTYAKKYGLNVYDKSIGIRTIPPISSHVKRKFIVGETVKVWVMTDLDGIPVLVTNLVKGEVICDCVGEVNQGKLYVGAIHLKKEGSYFLTVRVDDAYANAFKDDLQIIVIPK